MAKIQAVRKSIRIKFVRHAESRNNEVYAEAGKKFHWGAPTFDQKGWIDYVNAHRDADPGLSRRGEEQAEHLGEYLSKVLEKEGSSPTYVITSPMRRTIKTVIPTIRKIVNQTDNVYDDDRVRCKILVHAQYFEVEGCHVKNIPEPGMNQKEITEFIHGERVKKENVTMNFVGFQNEESGWYCHGKGVENRVEAENRSTQFYMWFCDWLDEQIKDEAEDIFDAAAAAKMEKAPNRGRRTILIVGHGEFMGYILRRIVCGFGHSMESYEGIPHRSTFVHFNTGISELEYFGAGRFLLMGTNHTNHLDFLENSSCLKSGGKITDGWSYIMPEDNDVLSPGLVTEFYAGNVDDHVFDQVEAMKTLYLYDQNKGSMRRKSRPTINEDEREGAFTQDNASVENNILFVSKRGHEVIGSALFNRKSGRLMDVIVRPCARKNAVGQSLIHAVKEYVERDKNACKTITVFPKGDNIISFFDKLGFESTQERINVLCDKAENEDRIISMKMSLK